MTWTSFLTYSTVQLPKTDHSIDIISPNVSTLSYFPYQHNSTEHSVERVTVLVYSIACFTSKEPAIKRAYSFQFLVALC